jgi:hypothetical protein
MRNPLPGQPHVGACHTGIPYPYNDGTGDEIERKQRSLVKKESVYTLAATMDFLPSFLYNVDVQTQYKGEVQWQKRPFVILM